MNKETMYPTNYAVAVNWCHNNFILFNEINEIDPDFWENCYSEMDTEGESCQEIFQYYLTDCTDAEVDFLMTHFGRVKFAHSAKLDKWVLLVDHYGTAWDYVEIRTDLKNAEAKPGERKNTNKFC